MVLQKLHVVDFRRRLVSHVNAAVTPMKTDPAKFNAKSASFLSQSLFRDRVATGNITLRVTDGSVPWESNRPLRKTCLQARCQRITGTRGNSLREKLLSFIPHPLLPHPPQNRPHPRICLRCFTPKNPDDKACLGVYEPLLTLDENIHLLS